MKTVSTALTAKTVFPIIIDNCLTHIISKINELIPEQKKSISTNTVLLFDNVTLLLSDITEIPYLADSYTVSSGKYNRFHVHAPSKSAFYQ